MSFDWHPFKTAEDDPTADWRLKTLADWYGDHVYDMQVEFDEISVQMWLELPSDNIEDPSDAYISLIVFGHDTTAGTYDLCEFLKKSLFNEYDWAGPKAQRVALVKVRDVLDELIAQCDEAIIRDASR